MTAQLELLGAKFANDVLVISFHDTRILQEAKIRSIGKELTASLTKAKKGRILVDFRGVEFMSSAMIGKLVLLHRNCRASDIQLQVCRVSENIMEVFRVGRLDKLFTFYSDGDLESLLDP